MILISAKPKAEQLADFLREEIRKCDPGNGGKIPSLRVLAKKFKTSPMVARKAFERLEKEGLLESRHGSGTYIREQMASGKSVAILNELDISCPDISYFYARIVQQLRLFFKKRNISGKAKNFYETANITNAKFARDFSPINKNSQLPELRKYSKAYLNYLFKIREPLALRLASLNNLEFYLKMLSEIRQLIKKGGF